MEWRFADGKYERFPELAAELWTRQMPLGMTASGHVVTLSNVMMSASHPELTQALGTKCQISTTRLRLR